MSWHRNDYKQNFFGEYFPSLNKQKARTCGTIMIVIFLLLVLLLVFAGSRTSTNGTSLQANTTNSAKVSFPEIVALLRQENNMTPELNTVLSSENFSKWKLLPSKGKDRVFVYPRETGHNEYWKISYDSAANKWGIVDPIYYPDPSSPYDAYGGYPYGASGYDVGYPCYPWPECSTYYPYANYNYGYNYAAPYSIYNNYNTRYPGWWGNQRPEINAYRGGVSGVGNYNYAGGRVYGNYGGSWGGGFRDGVGRAAGGYSRAGGVVGGGRR